MLTRYNRLCTRDCKHNYKWPSIQRCPILYNGNSKSFVWPLINKISMFHHFISGSLYKSELRITTEITEITHNNYYVTAKNCATIYIWFNICMQYRRYSNICERFQGNYCKWGIAIFGMEGHLKFRLQLIIRYIFTGWAKKRD